MEAGKVLVGLMMMVLVLFVLVVCTDLLLPIHQKMRLDACCRDLQVEVQLQEGLTEALRTKYEGLLERLGSSDVAISGPIIGQLKRGEQATLLIQGKVKIQYPSGFLSFNVEQQPYCFKGSITGRRIDN